MPTSTRKCCQTSIGSDPILFFQFSPSLCGRSTVASTWWWSSSCWWPWVSPWLACPSAFTTHARCLTRASKATKDSTCGTLLPVCKGTLHPSLLHHSFFLLTSSFYLFSFYLPSSFTDSSPPRFQALFGALALLCFLAAMRHHSLSERVANYREHLFVLVVLEDSLDWSFWLGVASIATHFAVCGVVAMSRIKLPKPKIKKPEEPTVSSLDMLY